MLRECIYGECAHEQHLKRTLTLTLTLTHTITAYSVSGNVVRVRILICATRQTPCRKKALAANANEPISPPFICSETLQTSLLCIIIIIIVIYRLRIKHYNV